MTKETPHKLKRQTKRTPPKIKKVERPIVATHLNSEPIPEDWSMEWDLDQVEQKYQLELQKKFGACQRIESIKFMKCQKINIGDE